MPTSCEELCILSGRGTSSGAASSIDRKRFAEILGEYKRHFGAVIVDIPAPTESTSSILLASETDGVVLVVEAEQADARVALRAKQSLLDARANIVGVVLNKRRQHVPGWLYRLL
jgi:Mrp family chromosome partitioning ATPase